MASGYLTQSKLNMLQAELGRTFHSDELSFNPIDLVALLCWCGLDVYLYMLQCCNSLDPALVIIALGGQLLPPEPELGLQSLLR